MTALPQTVAEIGAAHSSTNLPVLPVLTTLWLVGAAGLLLRGAITTLRLRRLLRDAVDVEGNVYECAAIPSPFVLGVLRPRIYLTAGLAGRQRELVLLHERAHIRRGDHIVKLLFFAALCLHWFNPLVWVAWRCVGRDIEMSCDERVMRQLGEGEKRLYSQTLLSLAAGRPLWGAAPLAFGESDVKSRIKNVLGYRKPVVGLCVVAAAAVAVVGVGFLANPLTTKTTYWHCHFHTLEPEGRPYVNDIYLEISRYGYPEDHIDAFVTNLLYSMVAPPTSYGYDITQVGSADELQDLYREARDGGQVVEYAVISDEPPHMELAVPEEPVSAKPALLREMLTVDQPADRWINSVAAMFAPYGTQGVAYNLEQDTATYRGEPIRLFVAYESGDAGPCALRWHNPLDNGALCLESVEQADGTRLVREMTADTARSFLGAAAVDGGEKAPPSATVSYVHSGEQAIQPGLVAVREIAREELPKHLQHWADTRDREKAGIYMMDSFGSTFDGYYVYVNDGGGYRWNVGASDTALLIRFYEHADVVPGGSTVLHVQTGRRYGSVVGGDLRLEEDFDYSHMTAQWE